MTAVRWNDAQTPMLSAVDPRDLVVRNIAYCRHPLNQSFQTRITRNHFDTAGRQIASWDPRLWDRAPKPNLATTYNLQGRPLLVDSVDAGWQLSLLDQAGMAHSFWDGRGSRRYTEFDALQRPTTITEQVKDDPPRVAERFAYGGVGDECAVHNHCGQLIRHDHPAGAHSLCEYGIGGLPLVQQTRFLLDLEPPDWPSDIVVRELYLETETFTTVQQYGFLGDVRGQTDAMGNVRWFAYNVAGELKETRLKLATSSQEPHLLVGDIRYDAFGRVESERAGNGVINIARYAGEDGHLVQLLSCDAQGKPLQNLNYGYDPVGNISSIEDKAQLTRHFNNQRIDPVSHYRYDSLYQLIEATGREVSQPGYGLVLPAWQNTPLDPNQLRNYTQTFNYDAAGNLQTRHHSGAQTFEMFTSVDSNRSVADEESLTDGFDANGNQQELMRGQRMSWDVRNQLSRVTMVSREDGPDDTECYFYDSPGHRLRKVRLAEATGRTLRAEVRYLPGLEIHRDNATGEERHVVSVEAGRSRVRALHWVTEPPAGLRNDQLRYCLSDHLNSCTLELDHLGALLSQEVYYPFGGTALWAGSNVTEARYKTVRYSGKERDATGLYYYGFRYYAPWLQRWVSADPSGDVDGLNMFTTVFNNPVNWVDAKGQNAVPAIAHFYWDGGDVPIWFLRNVLMFQNLNPEYDVSVWTSKTSQVLNTMADMRVGLDPAERELAYREGGRLNIPNPSMLFDALAGVYPEAKKIESLFYRESSGPYKNFAAASDILRLAATYVYGGLYMDGDVAVAGPVGELKTVHGFMAHIRGNQTSNAVIAAEPQSSLGKELLDRVVYAYSDEFAERFGRSNFGWDKKRNTPGGGLYSRYRLTIYMTGPEMMLDYVRFSSDGSMLDEREYSVPTELFFGSKSPRSTGGIEMRDMRNIFFGGYRRDIDSSGGWVFTQPSRRASVA
ncbi:RHS repeat-associated core domain-containing protein [Pseudomonas synxantha]|uniref:Insecticidal toxin complex protein TccC n=1 Tax=Pseudomonas synxantha TaxID=47883 RepID=A0ACC6JRE9_9PSED|nr:RHS repeat-associated core domain-containing protein [Pseudomonas synxantha]MDR6609112.1 insecticidal toxin complex protein TccC [Pseudomonas synxantha]